MCFPQCSSLSYSKYMLCCLFIICHLRTARKETGHTLGYAKRRNLDAVPERNFSGVELAVTRFLLHVCFYWSASHVSEASVHTYTYVCTVLCLSYVQYIQIILYMIENLLFHVNG